MWSKTISRPWAEQPLRALRIAVVTETWPPEVNGVAVTLAQLVEGLRQRHHDVQVVRPCQHRGDAGGLGLHAPDVLTRSLPVPRYPHLRMGVPCQRALRRLWSRQRPELVHIATEGPLGWSALLAARGLGLPVSSDFRTNFHSYCAHYGVAWMERPMLTYLRWFHNATQCTMVPTEAQRRELESLGLQRLVVVSRGVDNLRFHPSQRSLELRKHWGAQADDLVVACVGRLAAEKNLHLMVSAFNAISVRDPRARLVVVGDGPLRAELQSACQGPVHFVGQRGGDELAAHYASADVLLFPSLTETFGNVTTEAMASGLPVVAFDLAAAAQLIRHGSNGMLAPPGDTQAFECAALELAASADRRRAMGERARLAVSDLGWDTVAARFEAVLNGVLHEHRLASTRDVSLATQLAG